MTDDYVQMPSWCCCRIAILRSLQEHGIVFKFWSYKSFNMQHCTRLSAWPVLMNTLHYCFMTVTCSFRQQAHMVFDMSVGELVDDEF